MKPRRNRIIKSFSFQPEDEVVLSNALERSRQFLPLIDTGGPNWSEVVRLALHLVALAPDHLVQQASTRLNRVRSGHPARKEPVPLVSDEFSEEAFDHDHRQRLSLWQELQHLEAQPKPYSPATEARIQTLYRFFNMLPKE